jgi:hypothetical protein
MAGTTGTKGRPSSKAAAAPKETEVVVTTNEDAKVGNSNGGEGRKKPAQSGRAKLRWFALDGVSKPVNDGPAKATHVHPENGEFLFELSGAGDKGWKMTLTHEGQTITLLDNVSRTRAYYAATNFHHWDKRVEPKGEATEDAQKAS